jgi:hypothetical protein
MLPAELCLISYSNKLASGGNDLELVGSCSNPASRTFTHEFSGLMSGGRAIYLV